MHNPNLFLRTLLPFLPTLVHSWAAPSYSGYTLAWSDTFAGSAGASPNTGNWNIIVGDLNVNNELETYTASSENVQISGGETLQLVPWENGAAWTSGRVESVYTFTPVSGGKTIAEAEIRFGGNPTADKQGIWPAFWLLGQSLRTGGSWPSCGELDIMETINGALTGYGTAHCNVYPGGICNEPSGLQGSISIPDQEWHYWRLVFDNNASSWTSQSIAWYLDGTVFHTITGAQIGDEGVWNTLAHSALYFILDVAVGGDWPGDPNSSTEDGYGSMMEVAYVAVYYS